LTMDAAHMQTPSGMTPTNFASDFGRGHKREGSLDVSNGAFCQLMAFKFRVADFPQLTREFPQIYYPPRARSVCLAPFPHRTGTIHPLRRAQLPVRHEHPPGNVRLFRPREYRWRPR
jgi:hypothetical protein